MEFGILGPVEVWAGGWRLPLGGPKQRTLLAVLVVYANQVVSVERLVDALWAETPPATATAQVQSYVSALRRILDEGEPAGVGRDLLVTRPPGYLLAVEPGRLDLTEFDRRVEQSREARAAGRLPEAAEGLRAALAMWRGPALDGASGMAVAAEAARLEERRLAVLEERIEVDLELGGPAELVAELTALIAQQPLRDRLRGQLMIALYRAGRQAEALAVYHQGRATLAEEFGLDPGPELRALAQRILVGDADLHPVPGPVQPPADIGGPVPAQMERTVPALIWTKLQAPVEREMVPRRALLELLCAGRTRKLTLICAPAGWGKTSLLADWHACERETRPFAWFAVDRGDNDPFRFWTYLIEALRTLDPALGVHSLPLLRAPGVSLVAEVLPVLINELVTAARPSVLVLDDYHLIDNPAIDEGIAVLAEHLPRTLELVIATRAEPALPLARLRVRQELVEIDAQALRFSPDEATALLNDLHGLALDHDNVTRLYARTEGWAAGLYLATLTLRDRDDPRAFIDAFAGDHRHIVDYLGGEVLAGQPASVRDFLLRTSILDRLCAPLCDAVTGTPGSARMLTDLERSNSFLVPLDPRRRWYRYHHLFGELLRRELNLTEPDQVPALHRRAATWHLGASLVAEAIGHTITAGDLQAAAELIATHWNDFVQFGKASTVDLWLHALGDATVRGDARMCLVRAWTSFALGRLDEVLPWTEATDAAPLPAPIQDGTTLAAGSANLRAAYWNMVGHMGEVRHYAGETGQLRQKPARATNCASGMAAYWLGDTTAATAELEHTVRHGMQTPLIVVYALGHLAMIHAEQAEWTRAAEHASTALGLADEHGTAEYWMTAMAHIAQAKVLLQSGRLDDAAAAAVRGIELARRGNIPMDLAYGLITLAQARYDRGDPEGARELLRQARDTIAGCPDPGLLPDMIDAVSRRLFGPTADRRRTQPA